MISGVACDNYKAEKFEERLRAEDGFEVLKVLKFNDESTLIQVKHDLNRFEDLSKILKELELYFKRRN